MPQEEPSAYLSKESAAQIEQQAWTLVPQLFQDVVTQTRPYLFEIASSPESQLASQVQEKAGRTSAALRGAAWNGHDLSTDEGIRNVLEKLQQLCPLHVWIQPPAQVFSPWYNAQRPEEHRKEHNEQQKQQVVRYMVGCSIVVGTCMQRGIHVSIMMPEHNNAWRLPVVQQLVRRYKLRTCVTKGCRMNKRGTDNRLSRRGWKVCTTHTRLAELLDAPCVCVRGYQHSQSEPREEVMTEDFVKRVVQAVMQEHNHVSLVRELQGQSELSEDFGSGVRCTCEENSNQRGGDQVMCGLCLTGPQVQAGEGLYSGISSGSVEVSGLRPEGSGPQQENAAIHTGPQPDPETEPEEAHYCSNEVQQAEQVAKEMLSSKSFRMEHCQKVIEALPHINQAGRRQAQDPTDNNQKKGYYTFGLYAHGAFYGITRLTRLLPRCHQYFQQYLKQLLPRTQKYTSYVVSRNMHMPVHKDSHNDGQYMNCVHGVGTYQGGQLWVEHTGTEPINSPVSKVLPDGSERVGGIYETKGQLVQFAPKAWHGTEVWSGSRYVLSCYVSRSHAVMDEHCRKQLEELGFRVPKPAHEHIMTVNERALTKQERERE